MYIKYNKNDAFCIFLSSPLMIKNNKWWYIIQDENNFIQDKICTSKQLYTMYKKKFKQNNLLTFDEFLQKVKNNEINFN